MSADYFAPFDTIRFEGSDSQNHLAYRWYDKDRIVLGKRMEDHLRFAVCFWHTFCWPGANARPSFCLDGFRVEARPRRSRASLEKA